MSGGATDWLQHYFTGVTVEGSGPAAWWGWVYHGGHNGTWVNSISTVQGNITGAP